jgi:hypothetical protein
MLIGGAVGYTVGRVVGRAACRAESPIEKCQRAGRWEMFPCRLGAMAGADL